jgi:hypothetical protein
LPVFDIGGVSHAGLGRGKRRARAEGDAAAREGIAPRHRGLRRHIVPRVCPADLRMQARSEATESGTGTMVEPSLLCLRGRAQLGVDTRDARSNE